MLLLFLFLLGVHRFPTGLTAEISRGKSWGHAVIVMARARDLRYVRTADMLLMLFCCCCYCVCCFSAVGVKSEALLPSSRKARHEFTPSVA